MTRVIIADRQHLLTEGLRSLINGHGTFEVAAIATTRKELYHLLEDVGQGILITDPFNFPYEGISELKIFLSHYPLIRVMALTQSLSKADFAILTRMGIRNILLKNCDGEELTEALESASKGKIHYSEEILDLLTADTVKSLAPEETVHLTTSETEIVRLMARGLTTRQIAERKNISFHTANTHRKNIFRKAGVSKVSELIMFAIRAGWIDNIEYFI